VIRRAQRSAAVLGFALLCGACATPTAGPALVGGAGPQSVVDELLAADRAFSAASARTDLVSGLSAMFANDIAMPIPGNRFSTSANEAIEALRANPDNAKSRTEWIPVRGGIAADALQGYTWGYMTLHKPDGTTVPLKYLAYWIKRPEGWRVVAYKRRPRPPGEVSLAPVAPSLPPRLVAPSADTAVVERFRASLDETERAFSAESQMIGLGVAFARYGSADAVNMGGANDAAFVVGPEAIGLSVSEGKPAERGTLSWAPDRTIVATSGDLGVTIGLIRQNMPDAVANAPIFPFFTVWRRATTTAPWLYIAE
jgi:hypothetical protein